MTQHVLHITDCHLVPEGQHLLNVDTQASLEAVLTQSTNELQPDAIIASGDLTHHGSAEVYRRFEATVRRYSAAPMVCMPGNHDDFDAMQQAQLPMQPVELGGWIIAWLDSHIDGAPESRVDSADRAHLSAQLDATDNAQHLLVATHHPLVEVNSPWLDKDRIQNPKELLEWLAEQAKQHSLVLHGVVFGHAHQIIEARHEDWPLWGTPSTCFQSQPNSARFSVNRTPPGYRWITLNADGQMASTVHRVDDYVIEPKLPKLSAS